MTVQLENVFKMVRENDLLPYMLTPHRYISSSTTLAENHVNGLAAEIPG